MAKGKRKKGKKKDHLKAALHSGLKKGFGGKKSHAKGHVPIEILNKRLVRLNKVVAARPGGHPIG